MPSAVSVQPNGYYGLNLDTILAVVVNALQEFKNNISEIVQQILNSLGLIIENGIAKIEKINC